MATATATRNDISVEHLHALRKRVRKLSERPSVRLIHHDLDVGGSEETINVLRLSEPAKTGCPAGAWEVGLGDATTIRVWWLPEAHLTDSTATGSLMAIHTASVVHPTQFAESVIAALNKARDQREYKTWRLPDGM